MPRSTLVLTYPTPTKNGGSMKIIPNNTVSELQRLIPVLIGQIPDGQSTKVQNAIRLIKILVRKLSTLKDYDNERKQ
jgi:hypothetical protein